MDELEMIPEIQQNVANSWAQISTENMYDLTDFAGYKHEFLSLFGFDVDGVDYEAEVTPEVGIDQLVIG